MLVSYILPLRIAHPVDDEFVRYVSALRDYCEVIVVDGSPPEIFQDLHARCGQRVRHTRPDEAYRQLINGKVAGVLTGVRLASHERVIVADDDVRYDERGLREVVDALGRADVVRPQNYFDPLPWHAYVDTARTLINRVSGGDWPGTIALRRTLLLEAGGYCGDVMFENLELVRTITAVQGRELVAHDLYVRRLAPSSRHFLSQRVRQAYDEFARPARLVFWLSVMPVLVVLRRRRPRLALGLGIVAPILCAELGRRRSGGVRVFPPAASLAAPLWLLERAVCAWLALGARLLLGGVPYRGRIVRNAATPMRVLRARHGDAAGG